MKRKIVLNSLIVIFALVFVFAGYNIVKIIVEYSEVDKTYEDLQSAYVESVVKTDTDTDTESEEDESLIKVNFDELLSKNSDVVGWLYLPDSPINYPVAQADDNNKYLRHDLEGNYLTAGTLFVDYRNGPVNTDNNYVIYGHNMRNGSMFRCLRNYRKQEYYDTHPVIYYYTPDAEYKIELYAGLVVKSNASIYSSGTGKAELEKFMKESQKESTFKSNITLSETDKLVTLSTCSDESESSRYVVIGRLVEE